MTKMTVALPDTMRRAVCQRCGGHRNCEILRHYQQIEGDDQFRAHTDWYILKCRGCDDVFVQTVATNSEDIDYDYGPNGETLSSFLETVRYWPAHLKRKRPEWLHWGSIDADKGNRLAEALGELYEAYDHDLNMLAGIGLRTCFDTASELLGIDKAKTFEAKLQELEFKNLIDASDKSRLEVLVNAGSASAHRGWKPRQQDLSTFIDVLEHFIEDALLKPQRGERIDAEIAKIHPTIPAKAKKAASTT